MDHKDRTPLIVGIGVLLLLIGIPTGFLGPIEMYCFYLFSAGGRFHYEGFRFGSFMFGNIAAQVIGYYLIAAVLIPLGYGHLKMRRWTRTLALALLWAWLVVGAPLTIVVLFVLLASKDLSLLAAILAMLGLALGYLVVPGVLIRFYQSRNVRLTFEARDPNSYWTESLPMPILVLGSLELFYAVVLHVPILFNGIFPLFGRFSSGLQGIYLLALSIACLICLAWGTLVQRAWAWWGSLIYFGLMACSSILTLATSRYADILSNLNFPPREMEILDGLPFQGFHFAALIGVPLLLTLGLIFLSKRHFGPSARRSASSSPT
jgi:multisubunit Na+/H+ antiporter MnhE subunit